MADMRTWSHEFVTEFIEIYRSLPCLYDVKSKQYTNKPLKLSAYAQLVDKLKTVYPTATKDLVVKKINNMRSSYRKELKKMKQTKRSGASGEVYETSLWYFHLLDFLYDHEIPRKSKSNIQDLVNESDDDGYEREDSGPLMESQEENDSQQLQDNEDISQGEVSQDGNHQIQSVSGPSTPATSVSNQGSSSRNISKKRKATDTDQQEAILKLLADKMKNQHKYSNYAAYVGQELAALPSMMATYCQKLINDVLFEAKCGTLNGQSRIVTRPHNINNTVTNIADNQQSNMLYQTPESVPQQHGNVASTVSEHTRSPSWQTPSASGYYRNFLPYE